MNLPDVLGVLGFLLSSSVVAVRVWHHFRRPRFWPSFAELKLEALSGDSDRRIVSKLHFSLVFVGGGRARTIVDSGLNIAGSGGIAPVTHETLPVPANVSGRLQLESVSGFVLGGLPDELPCELRLDSGTEVYAIPITLTRAGEAYHFITHDRLGRVLPITALRRSRKTRVPRAKDWVSGHWPRRG